MNIKQSARNILMNHKAYIIAEIGVNHNGDLTLASDLIKKAKKCGANAVKFQTYNPELLVTPKVNKASYQKNNSKTNESQLKMLEKYKLSNDDHKRLLLLAKKIDIDFLSTPFDYKSLDFLVNSLKLKTIKISSTDINNIPFLINIGSRNINVIISSGMSNIEDIDIALSALAFGNKYKKSRSKIVFDKKMHKNLFKKENRYLKSKVSLLHCTSEYPAPLDELNLSVLPILKERYNIKVGYSDHSGFINTGSIARALDASIIETHITMNKNYKGPDHKSSLNIREFEDYINRIRITEKILGKSNKIITKSERKNIKNSAKVLVAIKDIPNGEKLTNKNLGIMRAGKGLKPIEYFDLLGKRVNRNIKIYSIIKKDYLIQKI